MRNLLITCVTLALMTILTSAVSGGERAGEISKSTLGRMGLGSMQALSDGDGWAVRGMGTRVRVYGPNYDVTRPHFAARWNSSISPGGGFSGGFSSASAW